MSILSTGISALNTAQLGLATTQHNIANANTPGYSRQSIMQATNFAVLTGAGAIGQGVHVNTIRRSYSDVLTGQLNAAQTQSSELDTYSQMISRIDNLLADSNSGLSPVLAEFFNGVQSTATNPTLLSSRQSMVSSAQALVTRFHTLESRLSDLYEESNLQIRNTVDLVNNYSQQISKLNEKIVALTSGSGQPPNDLLDQRDQLVLELNKLVRVSTVQDSQGSLNLFAGNGQQIVVGTQVMLLEARPSASDPERFVVGLKGGAAEFPEEYLTGGSLGGIFAFRREALDVAANSLGQVAASLALTVNAQHALGQDLLGASAGDAGFVSDFFTLSQPKSVQNTLNLGTGTVSNFQFLPPSVSGSGNFYTDITNSDYQVRFGAGGTFEVVRTNDKSVVATGTEGTAVTFDGLTLNFSAGHAAGDSYLLQPTREIGRNIGLNQEIVGDVRRIAAAAPIRSAPDASNVGSATLSQGEVAPGYSLANIPATLSIVDVGGGVLEVQGFPGGPVSYSGSTTISFDGMTFELSSGAVAGDQFVISNNTGGVADARNILKLGGLQTANTMNGGVATYQVSYAQLVSDIGTRTRMTQVNGRAQQVLLEQTQQTRDSVAGVNLDEEAANLIKYQQSYQAAARMMDTASRLFDTLLSIGR